jgi:hypothetical protein
MWINHGDTSSRTFLARTPVMTCWNDRLPCRFPSWNGPIVPILSCLLTFDLHHHLGKYIIYLWKVRWSGKVRLGWLALVMQLGGSLKTWVWSTYSMQGSGTSFILNRLWLAPLDMMHYMTQWNMHGQLNRFWGLNSTVVQCSQLLCCPFQLHMGLNLWLYHIRFLPTFNLFVCIICDFATLDFANPILHVMKVRRPKLRVQILHIVKEQWSFPWSRMDRQWLRTVAKYSEDVVKLPLNSFRHPSHHPSMDYIY